MNKIRAFKGISFADAEFKSFYFSEKGDLVINLKSWQELNIKINFKDAIQFSYKAGDVVKEMFETKDNSPFRRSPEFNL